MKLVEKLQKLKQETEDLTNRSSYLHSDAYRNAIYVVKSDKFPNLSYVNRIEQWQFFSTINDAYVAECVYSRFGEFDLVFDEFMNQAKDKISVFYVNLLHNPAADFYINRIDEITRIKNDNNVYMNFIPPLEICRTNTIELNADLHNEFIASKKYKIEPYDKNDSFFKVVAK